jgi:hypothetical protein
MYETIYNIIFRTNGLQMCLQTEVKMSTCGIPDDNVYTDSLQGLQNGLLKVSRRYQTCLFSMKP